MRRRRRLLLGLGAAAITPFHAYINEAATFIYITEDGSSYYMTES